MKVNLAWPLIAVIQPSSDPPDGRERARMRT
jgi:hypothetical protein